MTLRRRIMLAYTAILLMAVVLAMSMYRLGSHVDISARDLLDHHLPELELTAALQTDFVELERIMYEYYADFETNTARNAANLAAFRSRLAATRARIELGLAEFRENEPDNGSVAGLVDAYRRLEVLPDELARALESLPFPDNWDTARGILDRASELGRDAVTPILSAQLADSARAGAREQATATLASTGLTTRLTLLLAVLIVAIGGGIAFYVNRYISETAERRRLSKFVEFNPDAVLTVDLEGKVLYENPATRNLIDQCSESTRAEDILPPDLLAHIRGLQASGRTRDEWEYTHGQGEAALRLSCRVSLLTDFEQCHLHLRNVTDRYRARSRLEHLAYHDDLTESFNRRRLSEDLAALESVGERSALLLILRPDRFQRVTSSHGYQTGDQLVRQIARRTRKIIADSGYALGLYRLEGTQLAILGAFPTTQETFFVADSISSRLDEGFDEPFQCNDASYFLTLSMGLVIRRIRDATESEMIRDAHAALVESEEMGGGICHVFTEDMADKAKRTLALEGALRQAIRNEELTAYYQPQVSAQHDRLVGFESLLRWHSKEFGFVSPGEFIPIAEASELIMSIGDWVLEQSCKQAVTWHRGGLEDFKIAVNVSARQLLEPGFVSKVEATLTKTEASADLIELEITESAVIENVDYCIAVMQQLKGLGLSLALDDFGTGYSSLSYLKQFPLDKLKIDQSFVRELEGPEMDTAIVETVINMGKSLELTVLAEGVETEEQRRRLAELGCDSLQGYLIARPQPAPDLESFLAEWTFGELS